MMTDKKKPTLTVVSTSRTTSGADNTGTNTGTKTRKQGPAKAGQTWVNSEGLTVKQEAFCIAILNGTGWSDAYREAYDAENMAPATIHREAYALATNPKIAARLERAEREKQQEQRMQRLSRAERVVQKLEQIALRDGDTDGTQVRALELLGKTLGLFIDRMETEDKTVRDAGAVRAELEQRIARLIG
jgi:phage terminase small subunit